MTSNVREWLKVSTMARTQLGVSVPEGFKYACMEDYVNQNGVDFTSQELTDEEMKIVFDAVDNHGGRFQQQQCYYNAQMLVHHDDTNTLVYHEGWAFGQAIIAVQHGWAEINGKVIDLTWRLDQPVRKKGRLKNRVIGVFPKGYEYVGVAFPQKDDLRRLMLQRGWVGTLIDDWENGWPLLRGESLKVA